VKRLLIACVIAVAASSAHAFSPADQMQKMDVCRNVAAVSERGFQDRQAGNAQNRPDDASWIGGILMFAYDYGHDQAPSWRSAHMVPFSKCIDKLDDAAHRSPGNFMTEEEVSE
jgi:hypothetical protein